MSGNSHFSFLGDFLQEESANKKWLQYTPWGYKINAKIKIQIK